MDDDYMSEDILLGINAQSSSIAQSREQRRQLQIERHRDEALMQQKKKRILPADIERSRREEALSTPIGEESKGFALLAKMGFKPGMTLGKKRDTDDTAKNSRLQVPISLEMKTNRKGLGHEAHEDNERTVRVEQHLAAMRDQSRRHEELIVDFRKRRRIESSIKTVMKDVQNSRKACTELDSRMRVDLPCVSWFWRSYRKKEADEVADRRPSASTRLAPIEQEEGDEEEIYFYTNGKPAPVEIQWNELDEDELQNKLFEITDYLRTKYFYCVWCGSQFEGSDDLAEQCPGDSRAVHDSDDCHDD